MSYNQAIDDVIAFCDFYAEERIRLAGDSVLLDPCLSGKGFSEENVRISERLQIEGMVNSASYHAALQIAEHVREMKK